MASPRGKDFSALLARLKKENIDFVYYGGYYPEMGQMLRRARSVGLKTVFMGPEGVGNASLSNIAGAAAEGMLVTMPKRYDQDPANSAIVNALKAEKKDRADRTSGSPMPPCSRWRRRWTEPAASSRWI